MKISGPMVELLRRARYNGNASINGREYRTARALESRGLAQLRYHGSAQYKIAYISIEAAGYDKLDELGF